MNKIVVTGGGTGGHVFPALSLCEEFERRNFSAIYVGSKTGMEAKLAPQRKLRFIAIESGGIKNKGPLAILKALFKVVKSTLWSLRFLRAERPVAVVGVGGYVSAPVSLAAFFLGIPLFLQEQNSSVGIANRYLGKIARKIFLGFAEAKVWFPAGKCVVTGNPLRSEFRNLTPKAIDFTHPVLLVFGGSQGARAINEAVVACLPQLYEKYRSLHIIHQTGEKDLAAIQEAYRKGCRGSYEVRPFITDMLSVYQRACFVVCRSGALTISELIQVSRPALLVPFPRKGQNDQTTNAYLLQNHGAAVVVEQGTDFETRFRAKLLETFEPAVLQRMADNFSALHREDALVSIGDLILAEIQCPTM